MKENILIVDDDTSILDAFEEILTENGYSVGRAASEKEALDRLDTQEYHVAIVDVVLKETDGVELIEKIRERSKQAAIIMITGFPSVKSAVGSFHRGSFDYLEKPCNRKVLLDTIQRGLREKEEKKSLEINKNENIKQFFWSLDREWSKKLFNAKAEIMKLEKALYDLSHLKKISLDREQKIRELEKEVNRVSKELEEAKELLEVKVEERTKELKDKIECLEKMSERMTDRELRMVELKNEINGLCEELGRPRPYSEGFR